jgi:hypothetical protein
LDDFDESNLGVEIIFDAYRTSGQFPNVILGVPTPLNTVANVRVMLGMHHTRCRPLAYQWLTSGLPVAYQWLTSGLPVA